VAKILKKIKATSRTWTDVAIADVATAVDLVGRGINPVAI